MVALLLIALSLPAQISYDGFVVLNNGDTVHGRVQMQTPTLNEIRVILTTNTSDAASDRDSAERVIYPASAICSYAMSMTTKGIKGAASHQQFIRFVKYPLNRSPILFDTHKDALLMEIERGTVKLYYFFYENPNTNPAILRDTYIEYNHELILIDADNFIEVFSGITATIPTIQAKLNTRGYDYTHIDRLARLINDNAIREGFNP